jgi:hypothetical protein
MTTQTIMKARIADELARDDLTSQIVYAIADAIDAYQDERWYFNESRAITVTTVADQEFYSSSDASAIGTITKIDYVFIYIGDQPYELLPLKPADIEAASVNGTSTGEPSWYCWYNNQIRLYPVPSDAWTVRIGAAVTVAAPATDGEADNPWMTKAERLIRSRAKLELALHVLKDTDLAATMSQAVEEAFEQLKERTNQLTQSGEGRVTAMCF